MSQSSEAAGERKLRVAIFVYRIGPYHFARFREAGKMMDLHAIEYTTEDSVYAWDSIAGSDGFKRRVLFQHQAIESRSLFAICDRINHTLDEIQPDCVAIPGWSGIPALGALNWCQQRGIPAVVMSETTAWDFQRRWYKELPKRYILSFFSAALVGGTAHRDYLQGLGFDTRRVFFGYDAVDNTFFETQAKRVCENASRDHLPEKFFLASARFVPKKNLGVLIEAYARYVSTAGAQAWDLILLGDGPCKKELLEQIQKLNLSSKVLLPGFKQYQELPQFYARASCFIHASTTEQWGLVVNEAMASGLPVIVSQTCGCSCDLVRHGQNGFVFDPNKPEELAQYLETISKPGFPLTEFAKASREIVRDFGAERFADGLSRAVQSACAQISDPRPFLSIPWLHRLLGWSNTTLEQEARLAQQKHCVVFKMGRRPIIAFPKRPKSLRKQATRILKTPTLRRWTVRQTFSVLNRIGLLGLYVRPYTPSSVGSELIYERWKELLEVKLGKTDLDLIITWPAERLRNRAYIHAFDSTGQVVAFTKISFAQTDQEILRRETSFLRKARRDTSPNIHYPRCLADGFFNDAWYSIMEAIPTEANTPAWRDDFDPSGIIASWQGKAQEMPVADLLKRDWWWRYEKCLPENAKLFHRMLTELLVGPVWVAPAHGDLGLSNIVQKGSETWVFDWEYAEEAAPVLADDLGFYMSFHLGKGPQPHETFAASLSKLCGRKNSLKLGIRDVMLALAFRQAWGLPDAKAYLESWPEIVSILKEKHAGIL